MNLNIKKNNNSNEPKENSTKKPSFNMDTLKKYFNEQTFLGVTVVGILAFVAVYSLVYLDYVEKTEALEASNMALKQELNTLQDYYNNMETYKTESGEMRTAIEEILAEYPAEAREEDILMLAVDLQQSNDIDYRTINMDETEGVYTVTSDLMMNAGMQEVASDVVFAQKHATYVNTTSYEDLKEVIAGIYASENRIGINNIVYVKNEEEGVLEGNIDLYFYSAQGTGKEYAAPDMGTYESGTANIFGLDSETLVEDNETE